jgi:hypothetical protein
MVFEPIKARQLKDPIVLVVAHRITDYRGKTNKTSAISFQQQFIDPNTMGIFVTTKFTQVHHTIHMNDYHVKCACIAMRYRIYNPKCCVETH